MLLGSVQMCRCRAIGCSHAGCLAPHCRAYGSCTPAGRATGARWVLQWKDVGGACTIRARTGARKTESLLGTIRISEAIELRKKGCTDTFVHFCKNLKAFILDCPAGEVDELKHLRDLGVRHEDTIIHKSMLNAVHLERTHFSDACHSIVARM